MVTKLYAGASQRYTSIVVLCSVGTAVALGQCNCASSTDLVGEGVKSVSWLMGGAGRSQLPESYA